MNNEVKGSGLSETGPYAYVMDMTGELRSSSKSSRTYILDFYKIYVVKVIT